MFTILPDSTENEKSNSRMLHFFTQAKDREQLQKMLKEFCSGLNSYQVSFSTRERVSVMDTQCD